MEWLENEDGQSTIEFLISLVFVFGFLFLFLRISFVYTNGYLVHYATYSAARAYLVFENNSNDPSTVDGAAETKARAVFKKFKLEEFISNFPTNGLKINAPDEGGSGLKNNLYVGNWVEYQDSFSVPGNVGGRIELNMRSDALLGREPTRSECALRVCDAIKEIGGNCEYMATLFDNGC